MAAMVRAVSAWAVDDPAAVAVLANWVALVAAAVLVPAAVACPAATPLPTALARLDAATVDTWLRAVLAAWRNLVRALFPQRFHAELRAARGELAI